MKRIIAHIGDAKCGSSAIQRSLYDRKVELEEKYSIHYRTGSVKSHAPLVSLIAGRSRTSVDIVQRRAAEIVYEVGERINSEGVHIFSSENLMRIGPEKFKELLSRVGFEEYLVDVICYVRSPEDHYLSFTQQALKGNIRFTTPEKSRRPLHELLENWKCHEYTNSLTVKKFAREALPDGDIVKGFDTEVCRLLGLKDLGNVKNSTRVNETLSAEQMVVLQWFRSQRLTEYEGMFHPESNSLIRFFKNINATNLVGNKPVLNRAAKECVLKNNHDVFQSLKSGYGIHFKSIEDLKKNGKYIAPEVDYDSVSVAGILDLVDFDLVDDLKISANNVYKRSGSLMSLENTPLGNEIVSKYNIEIDQYDNSLNQYNKRAAEMVSQYCKS